MALTIFSKDTLLIYNMYYRYFLLKILILWVLICWCIEIFLSNSSYANNTQLFSEEVGMIEHTILQRDQGNTFEVSLSEKISIQLAENPTTGYRWQLDKMDDHVLTLQSSDFAATAENSTGSAGKRIFTFIAQSSGIVTIHLQLMREWMSPDEAIEHFEVTIKVIQ